MNNTPPNKTKGNIMAENPFDIKQKTYTQFPNDVYTTVCVLSYQTAMLPPSPLADSNDPVLSTRFLMGGYIKDESGQLKCDDTGAPILVRKWTSWIRISFNKNAKLLKLFKGFTNLVDILKDNSETDGKLWKTPMKIMVEQADGSDYQNITCIKPDDSGSDICDKAFYDEAYIPYKVVKAYARPVALSLAGCKFKSGVKTFEPSQMADAPTE